VRVREVIRPIEVDGWYPVATKRGRRQYRHPEKPGRITVAGQPGDDLSRDR